MVPTEANPTPYRLRPVTEGDVAFLFDLKRSAYREHVETTWGEWDDASQRDRFMSSFDPASTHIVVAAERDVGALTVDWTRDPVVFASVELLPEVQRQGLGTQIIEDVLDRARALGRRVELQVLKANADARRLYERLGFVVMGESESHTRMVWITY